MQYLRPTDQCRPEKRPTRSLLQGQVWSCLQPIQWLLGWLAGGWLFWAHRWLRMFSAGATMLHLHRVWLMVSLVPLYQTQVACPYAVSPRKRVEVYRGNCLCQQRMSGICFQMLQICQENYPSLEQKKLGACVEKYCQLPVELSEKIRTLFRDVPPWSILEFVKRQDSSNTFEQKPNMI